MFRINLKTPIFAILVLMFFVGCANRGQSYFRSYNIAGSKKSDCSTCRIELPRHNNI